MSRVAVDVDGVLADFAGALADWVEARTGQRPTRAPDDWDHMASWGCSELWPHIRASRGAAYEMARHMAWYPRAQETLAKLSRDHNVVIATSPMNAAWLKGRAEWLEDFGIPADRQIHLKNKSWLATDYLIDDGVHNLTDFRGQPICIARPWNADCPLHIPRVDFENVLEYIR